MTSTVLTYTEAYKKQFSPSMLHLIDSSFVSGTNIKNAKFRRRRKLFKSDRNW